MSYQNADDKNTIKSESSSKSDREQAIALRAMALATQDPSPIFELKVDCWEEIFDWLSMSDVHAFGQTCKFFHRIAGKYFEWKYRRTLVQAFDNEMTVNYENLEGFYEFAQRLSIDEYQPDISLLNAFANCKSLNELKFRSFRTSDLNMNRLENMMASVEVLAFGYLPISDKFTESILKICATNLKRLSIGKTTGCDWMHYKYPKLQHLELHVVNSAQELVQFLAANPNVRSFSMDAKDILKYKSEFMASTIELDDLTVPANTHFNVEIDGTPNALTDLYNRGFYKRLNFATSKLELLADLPGLTMLEVRTDISFDFPNLPFVTSLLFTPIWCGRFKPLNMDGVTNALTNLESVLMLSQTSMEFIMPFIRKSKKLKEIKTQDFRGDFDSDIDPVLMNSERAKLDGAHKVTIYVEEKDYLRIKWKYSKSDFGLIEIRRNDSYDGVWDIIGENII